MASESFSWTVYEDVYDFFNGVKSIHTARLEYCICYNDVLG